MTRSGEQPIGRADLNKALGASVSFFGDERVQGVSAVRDAETYAFLRRHGHKTDRRWEVSCTAALDNICVTATSGSVDIQFIDSPRPIVSVSTSDADAVAHQISLRLRWELAGDKQAKSELDAIERGLQELRYAAARKRADAGRERIQPKLARLRQGIRELAPIFEIDLWSLSEIGGLRSELTALSEVRQSMSSRGSRSGNVDEVVRRVLGEFSLYSIVSEPELLSATGFLVDADDVLAVLRIRERYRRYQGHHDVSLLLELQSGYRPHTEIIKSLPRHIFHHPAYFAPVEDLFDWLAIDFYAGQRAGDAEDGAVGWLVDRVLRRKADDPEVLTLLAGELRHWTLQRLDECLNCWRERVSPLLYS